MKKLLQAILITLIAKKVTDYLTSPRKPLSAEPLASRKSSVDTVDDDLDLSDESLGNSGSGVTGNSGSTGIPVSSGSL